MIFRLTWPMAYRALEHIPKDKRADVQRRLMAARCLDDIGLVPSELREVIEDGKIDLTEFFKCPGQSASSQTRT